MRKPALITLLAAALLSAVSCAKEPTENTNRLEEMAFDAWMEKYVNSEGIVAQKQENGMYVQFIDDGDQNTDSARDTIVWLRMNYTATDLQNNVFATRYEDEALRQGTYTPQTHYIPDYLFCGDENYSMITGQYYSLKNGLVKPDGTTVKLGEGAKVRVYMPSYLAFGSSGYSDDQGYGGQYSLSGTKPIVQDLEVVEVVKDPVVREENLVRQYALDKWGLAEADTTATCLYIDTVRFNQELSLKHGKDMSLPFKAEYALTADSTARIWYVKKFLDGFILETNIDTVYNRFYNRRAMQGYYTDSETLSVMSYKPESNKDEEVSAFYTAIPHLRRGQWSRILFTSAYGYGSSGLSAALIEQQEYYNYYMSYLYSSSYGYGSSYYGSDYYNSYYYDYSSLYSSSEEESGITTEIQPYTPLVYEIYIEADEEE